MPINARHRLPGKLNFHTRRPTAPALVLTARDGRAVAVGTIGRSPAHGGRADLIEEVARIHGYARLPLSPTPVSLPAVSETESVVPEACNASSS